jgi:predicted dehydrogenase
LLRISERSLALENDAYTEPGIVTNKKELPLMKVNRRTFVSAGVSGVAAATTTGLGARSALGANNRIRVASIGVGGMGRSDLRDFLKMPEVDIVAVCDTWEQNRNRAVEMTGGKAVAYKDFREVLDRKDIDAVIIATPDHWHVPIALAACDAGKDMYVEKPLSHTVEEGRKLAQAVTLNKKVLQMGTQQRSGKHYQEAVGLIRAGELGKITRVHTWNFGNEAPTGIGNHSTGEPPAGLDWDMYLGPAPYVPFSPNRFIYYFRWFWDYSGGKMTDWGTHHFDIIHWAMNVQGPESAFAVGHKYALEDNRETPDTMEVIFEYPGFIATFSHRDCNAYAPQSHDNYGIEFFGTDGTMYLNRNGFWVTPEMTISDNSLEPYYLRQVRENRSPRQPWEDRYQATAARSDFRIGARSNQHIQHVRNFIDCLKSREKPISDVETGHRSTTAPLLANIALKVGRKIHWDLESEKILDDKEASLLLTKQYRGQWKV